jgi:peptidyl-prolyl cis-trans isomerase B (cyclophilin B)
MLNKKSPIITSFLMAGILAGCGKKTPSEPLVQSAANTQKVDAVLTSSTKPEAASSKTTSTEEDPLHIPFEKAARFGDNPPETCHRPPDETVSKKPVYRIFQKVQDSWKDIRFKDAQGRDIEYIAKVETTHGSMVIELNSKQAPNHVRNFIALSKAGYYDGLFFEKNHFEQSEEDPNIKLEQVQAGCGSIGYWMNPESSPEGTHAEGTIGAYFDLEPDTAACRFYINLTKAPFMDGNYTAFGKVIEGLDHVRKIYNEPVNPEDKDKEGSRRLEKPVQILKVVIQTKSDVNKVVAR